MTSRIISVTYIISYVYAQIMFTPIGGSRIIDILHIDLFCNDNTIVKCILISYDCYNRKGSVL